MRWLLTKVHRHPSQVKTLDHKPPMTQVEFDAYVLGTHTLYTAHYNMKTPQNGTFCQTSHRRGYPSKNDHKGLIRFLLRSRQSGWANYDCGVSVLVC